MNEQPASDGQLNAGDVCIVVGCVMYPECNGREVTIVGPAEAGPYRCARTGSVFMDARYPTSDPDELGRPVYYSARNLRKKRPPREDLKVVRWDQCPWQPEKINAA